MRPSDLHLHYVQYGCGFRAPATWINFDASLTLRFEKLLVVGRLYTKNERRFPANVKYADVIKGLPLDDHSCRGVYASHVLHHLSLEEFRIALGESFRVLAAGGIFRMVVPDLEPMARRYLADLEKGCPHAAVTFIQDLHLGRTKRRSLIGAVRESLSGSMRATMWDYPSLEAELVENRFVSVRRAYFHDSEDPAFLEVEDEGRFLDACAAEARKPGK